MMTAAGATLGTMSGVILGWIAVPLLYIVATTLLARYTSFYKSSYNKWHGLYVFVGMIISTLQRLD